MINHIKILTFLTRKLKKKKNIIEERESFKMKLRRMEMKRKRTFMMIVTYLLIVFWLVEVYPPMVEDKSLYRLETL
jgi:hypothetical protein